MWRYLWNSDRHDHEEFGRGPQCSQHALRVSLGIFSGINVVLSQIMGWFFALTGSTHDAIVCTVKA